MHVLIGGRLDSLDQTTTTSAFTSEIDETEFSPRVGLVVKPLVDKGFSAFLSYGESFTPNTVLTADGNSFGPRDGRSYEAGIAYTFNDDRLTASFTAFDIEEDNVPISDGGGSFLPTV